MKTAPVNSNEHQEYIVGELEALIVGGNAHASFEDAVKNVAPALLGMVPPGLPYSIWQLVEHIRIVQWDILEFSRNSKHVSPEWPSGYWPKEKAPLHTGDFKKTVDMILADRKEFVQLLKHAGDKLYTPFEHGDGQTLFREALLIADHTSYHTGEIIIVRRLLKDWN